MQPANRVPRAFLMAVVVVAGCRGAGDASRTTPVTSGTPSTQVTASSAPNAAEFPPFEIARAAVDDLELRQGPSTSAAAVDDAAANRLGAGDRVMIVDGPVAAEGFNWFLVALERPAAARLPDVPVGWVASGTAAEPWLEPGVGVCPTPSLRALSTATNIDLMGCYQTMTLAMTAYVASEPVGGGLGGACEAPPPTPAWLVCDNVNYNYVNAHGGAKWQFLLHFDPDSGVAETGLAPAGTVGPRYQIRGHFFDEAAKACVTAPDPDSLQGVSQWLSCAQRFVVDNLKPMS